MTRQEAIYLFKTKGSTHPVQDLADALGVTSQCISKWPNVLREYHIGRLMVAAKRLGLGKKLEKLI